MTARDIFESCPVDLQAHFGWGAMICAIIAIVGLMACGGEPGWADLWHVANGTLAALAFAIIKDYVVDREPNIHDIIATAAGVVPIWLAFVLGITLYKLIH